MENGRNGVVSANTLLLPSPANKYQQRIELVNLGVMERKKHLTTHTDKSRIIGLLIASVLPRRILHRTLISAISAFSASLLLIFALFSLSIPSPVSAKPFHSFPFYITALSFSSFSKLKSICLRLRLTLTIMPELDHSWRHIRIPCLLFR